jgi:hypothetical protein
VLGLVIDLMDSYMKGGWTYVRGTGILTWGENMAGILAAIIGFRSTNVRTHSMMAILFFLWEIFIGFEVSPLLHI